MSARRTLTVEGMALLLTQAGLVFDAGGHHECAVKEGYECDTEIARATRAVNDFFNTEPPTFAPLTDAERATWDRS